MSAAAEVSPHGSSGTNSPLPAGWRSLPLSRVAEARLGKMLDAAKNRGELRPYLRNPNVRWMELDLSDLKEMPFEPHEEDKFAIRDGDVLICEGGEAGRAAIWQGPDVGIKFQKAIHRVRCGPDLHNRYFVHKLMYDYHNGDLADYLTGATIKHITGQDLARYQVILPPLDEQRRIASILDQADALRRMRRRTIENLEGFVSATFTGLFAETTGGASEVRLGDLFEITRGGSPRPIADFLTDDLDGLNWVSISDATDNGKFIRTVKRRIRPSGASRSRRVEPGDFLLTNSMSFGRPYIMATTGYIHDGWLSLRPKDGRIDQEYLYRALSSRQIYGKFARLASGATVKNLNIDLVRTVTIPVPPLAVQNRFADIARSVDHAVDRAKAHLAMLDALFASLQHRAFRGEL